MQIILKQKNFSCKEIQVQFSEFIVFCLYFFTESKFSHDFSINLYIEKVKITINCIMSEKWNLL